jgi:hypothetical protein
MGIYRWIGSGNTGSTSANIFNWNQPGNWEVATYIGPGASAGWQFRGTTACPGINDEALFGNLPNGGYITINPNISMTKVRSPCLFGGFVGNAGGGTWTNASSGQVSGTTYTSSLLRFTVNYTNNYAYITSPTTTSEGYTAYAGSYNDCAYEFVGALPLGGGISGNAQCFENLKWLQTNYPNMGVAADLTGGSYYFTIPASYASTWDNLNIKTSVVNITSQGNSGSSPINLNFVTAYSPLSGVCGSGFTGINSPVVLSSMDITTSSNLYLSGGAFKSIGIYPAIKRSPSDPYGRFPDITIDNMFVETLTVPEVCDVTIGSAVRFINLNTTPIVLPYWSDGGNNNIYNTYNKGGNNPRIIRVYGSGSVTQVNAVLYPGNSANTSSLKSTIRFGSYNSLNYQGVPGGVTLSNASLVNSYQWSVNSAALQNYFGGGPGYFYRTQLVPNEFDSAQYWGQEFGTLKMMLGTPGVTNDVEIVDVQSAGLCTKIVHILGPININELNVGKGSYVKFDYHTGIANIGLVNLHPMSTLNLQNPYNDASVINFGIRTTSGVCGGIQLDPNFANTVGNNSSKGTICLEAGERLFNVNTLKAGAIQVPGVGETTYFDIAAPAVARKG